MPGDASELMYGYLNPSERRLPLAGDADGAVPGSLTDEDYALGPIAVTGTLPGRKAVDIIFTSIVNNFSNQVIPTFNNTSTVEDSGAIDSFPSVTSANDPLIVDTVSISSTIFIDANRNGDVRCRRGRLRGRARPSMPTPTTTACWTAPS